MLKRFLSNKGIQVTGSCAVPGACSPYILQSRLTQFKQRRNIARSDCIAMLTCSAGVKSAYLLLEGKKRIVPLLNTIGDVVLASDWPPSELKSPCSGCEACVLGITNGICPIGNCPLKLRIPCRREDELTKECKVDKNHECVFFKIKEQGNLGRLMAFEKMLKDSRDKPPLPLFDLPRRHTSVRVKKLLAYGVRFASNLDKITSKIDY
jgi:hypothetical protein